MAHPMGEAKPGPPRVYFDRRLKLEFHGSDTSAMNSVAQVCVVVIREDDFGFSPDSGRGPGAALTGSIDPEPTSRIRSQKGTDGDS